MPRSTVPLAERRGMLFVANFRHEPNKEAIEYLCAEVLPAPSIASLLELHPVRVIGNRLAEAELDIDERTPGLQLVGWVPTITSVPRTVAYLGGPVAARRGGEAQGPPVDDGLHAGRDHARSAPKGSVS